MRGKTIAVRIPKDLYDLMREQADKSFIPVSAEVAGRLAESLTGPERERIAEAKK